MKKQIFKLVHATARQRALHAVAHAADGLVVEIKEATRSLDQNALLWPLLAEVSEKVEWYGRKLSSEDWKHIFTASLKNQDSVPGLNGEFVVLGQSTSQMGKRMFSELIELIYAFGAERGIEFREVVEV